MKKAALKLLAVAYLIALEYDCVPDETECDDVCGTLSAFDPQTVYQACNVYAGHQPTELAEMMANGILQKKEV